MHVSSLIGEAVDVPLLITVVVMLSRVVAYSVKVDKFEWKR